MHLSILAQIMLNKALLNDHGLLVPDESEVRFLYRQGIRPKRHENGAENDRILRSFYSSETAEWPKRATTNQDPSRCHWSSLRVSCVHILPQDALLK